MYPLLGANVVVDGVVSSGEVWVNNCPAEDIEEAEVSVAEILEITDVKNETVVHDKIVPAKIFRNS